MDVCHLRWCRARAITIAWTRRSCSVAGTPSHRRRRCSAVAHGHIYLADTPELEISATEIRQRRHQGLNCDDLLPRPVQRYIELRFISLAKGVIYCAAFFRYPLKPRKP